MIFLIDLSNTDWIILDVESSAEQLLFTTVKIETKDSSGKEWVGTGFLFNYKKEKQYYPFVVTNKHVVKDMVEGTISFMKGKDKKPILGQSVVVTMGGFEIPWHGHPDSDVDIAIMPLTPLLGMMLTDSQIPYYRTIPLELIPSEDVLKEIDAIEDIIFIGYPKGLWDEKNFLPITRSGITATHPVIDYGGRPKFLIDASVFPGSSGSPVFLYDPRPRPGKIGTIPPRLYFMGVVSDAIIYHEENQVKEKSITIQKSSVVSSIQIMDLGVVYKAKTVVETIEDAIKMKKIPLR